MESQAVLVALGHTSLGRWVGHSKWAFATIETFHLLSLGCLGGVLIVMHLRWAGWLLPRSDPRELMTALRLWLIVNLIVMTASGLLMVVGNPLHYYYNPFFRLKLLLLILALPLFFVLSRLNFSQPSARLTGLVGLSLLLWFGVAASGRAIGLW